MIFSPQPANFSASDKPEVEIRRVPNRPQKTKNRNSIKWVRNGNRSKRKCHTSFFAFHIFDSKIVPVYSELNSVPGNHTHFFSKKWVCYLEKQPNLKKRFEIKKMTFVTERLKTVKPTF